MYNIYTKNRKFDKHVYIYIHNSNLHLNDVEISLNVLLTRRMATVTDS